MKKHKLIFTTLLLVISPFFFKSSNASPTLSEVSVSFQLFYDDLTPYGNWILYPGYGYAWIPDGGAAFRPYYTNGHWVFTDAGWMWVSNYEWGWAPFHYGSWMYDDRYGWLWIPGYDWAPAWVEWGTFHDYYGWAPIGPGFSFSVSYYAPVEHWCFLSPVYMSSPDFGNHVYVARNHRISISDNVSVTNVNRISLINNSGKYDNHPYYSGPSKPEFEKLARTTIQPVSIKDHEKPGKSEISSGAISIYRPTIKNDKSATKPSRLKTDDQVKKNDQPSKMRSDKKQLNHNSMKVAPEAGNKQPDHDNRKQIQNKSNRNPVLQDHSAGKTGSHPENKIRENKMKGNDRVHQDPAIRKEQFPKENRQRQYPRNLARPPKENLPDRMPPSNQERMVGHDKKK